MWIFIFNLLRVCWASWCVDSCLLSNLESFMPHLFIYFFCPFFSLLSFWESHYVYVSILDGVAHAHLFIFILIFFCFSQWIIAVFKFASFYYACSNMVLQPSFQLLTFRISFFPFYNFYWYFVKVSFFLVSFSSFYMVFFSSEYSSDIIS